MYQQSQFPSSFMFFPIAQPIHLSTPLQNVPSCPNILISPLQAYHLDPYILVKWKDQLNNSKKHTTNLKAVGKLYKHFSPLAQQHNQFSEIPQSKPGFTFSDKHWNPQIPQLNFKDQNSLPAGPS